MVFIGGLIGSELSTNKALATLPIALFIVGNALVTIPAAMLAQRFGRKRAGYTGFTLSLTSAGIYLIALQIESFYLFSAGGLLLGAGSAFYYQFRFAAIESLSNPNDAGPALSVIMLSSIVGALTGPEIANFGKQIIPGFADYSGTFLIYAVAIIIAMLVFTLFKNPEINADETNQDSRPLGELLAQPGLLIAIASGSIGYALMSFLMTSTPLSMHLIDGHSLHDAKGVIQAHLAAMFLPSLVSGFLIKNLGAAKTMLLGCILYLAVILVATSGQDVLHYWWALVLLGVGWNFLFLSGTTLLPDYYRRSERFRAQAINDFCIFSLQAGGSLGAAWVLFNFGWSTQLWICLLPSAALTIAAVYMVLSKNRGDTLPADGK